MRLCQYMYSIMKCNHIHSYSWDIAIIKKYGNGPFCPDPGAKRHILCHFAPNGMFHCINVLQTIFWLIRLTNLRLAQIVAHMNNIDSTKSKHSWHFGQYIKTLKIFLMDYSLLFSLKHAMLSSLSTNSSNFKVTDCCLVTLVWCYCPACRTSLIATRFWVVVICPIIKCLTELEFSFILFDLCLFIAIFNFILNYVPIVTFLDSYLS